MHATRDNGKAAALHDHYHPPASVPPPRRSDEAIADLLVGYVAERDHVTFVELERFLADHMTTEGYATVELDCNVVFWDGMSERFADLVAGLLNTHRLFLHPATLLTYLIDGATLSYPLVGGAPPPGGYKRRRWAPAVLRTVPLAKSRRDER